MHVDPDFVELLRTLTRHRVEFIVCGGIAAVLHGAPLPTVDLDVLFETSEENCGRLLAALDELEAVYVDVAGRTIVPDRAKVREMRMHLLNTNRGRLDVMREIGDGLDYAGLVGRVETFDLEGTSVRVLELAAIIESKEAAGRPKDLAALPYLRALLRERSG